MTTTAPPTPDQLPSGWSGGAAAYDEWFAPLTAQFAADVVDLLAVGPGQRFLDVAAGSGVLTRAAAAAGASVLAVDFAPGMVELLRASTTGLDVTALQMDGQALDVDDGRFDAAASLFGLIFFPDLAAGTRELRRSVRPGGRVAVVAWDEAGFAIPPLVGRTLGRVLGDVQAGMNVAMRLGHPDPLADLLRDAGLHDVEVRAITHAWRPTDPAAFLRSAPHWAQPLRPLFDGMTAEQLDHAAEACAEVLDEMSGGTGELPCTALVGLGTR